MNLKGKIIMFLVLIFAFIFNGCTNPTDPNIIQQKQNFTGKSPVRLQAPNNLTTPIITSTPGNNITSMISTTPSVNQSTLLNSTPTNFSTPMPITQNNVTCPGSAISPKKGISDNPTTNMNFKRADRIMLELSKMKELNQVNVMVNGNTVLIAFTQANFNDSIPALKNMINKRVKQLEGQNINICTTDSSEVVSRIRSLDLDLRGNRPINNISNEFNNIVQGIGTIR